MIDTIVTFNRQFYIDFILLLFVFPLRMSLNFIRGLRKEFFTSFLIVFFIFIYIQSLIVFGLVMEKNYADHALNNEIDFTIRFDPSQTTHTDFQKIPQLVTNYSSLLSNGNYVSYSSLFCSAANYSSPLFNAHYYFISSSFLSSFFGISLESAEVFITSGYASHYNLTVGSSFIYSNHSYTVKSILPYSSQIPFITNLADIYITRTTIKTHSSFHDFIIFPDSSLNLTNIERLVFLCYSLRYDRELLSDLQYNSLQTKISSFDTDSKVHLSVFEQHYISLYYRTVLYNSVTSIRSDLVNSNLIFLAITFPLLLSLFYFARLFNTRLKQVLHTMSIKLWMKGFSRKQTFNTFLFLLFLLSILLFFIMVVFNFLYLSLLGANPTIFYISSSVLFFSFLAFFLLQIRSFYHVTNPKRESYSLLTTASEQLNTFISSINTQPPRPKYKTIIIALIISIISGLLVTYPYWSIIFSILFKINLSSYIETALFFLMNAIFGDGVYPSNPSGIDRYLTFSFGFTNTVFLIASIVFWVNYIPLLLARFHNFIYRKYNDTVSFVIHQKFFRIFLYDKQNLGKFYCFLFFFTLLALPIANTMLINSQGKNSYLSNGDILIYSDEATFNGTILEQFLQTPAVRVFLPVYQGEGAIISKINHHAQFFLLDPASLLEYNQKTTSNIFFRNSFSGTLKAMIEDPSRIVLGSHTFNTYHHYYLQELWIRVRIEDRLLDLNATIYDTASYNPFEPKSLGYRSLEPILNLVSTSAMNSPLNISTSKYIFISLNEGYDVSEFVKLLDSVVGIPRQALELNTSDQTNTLVPTLVSWTLLSTLAIISLILSFQLYRNDAFLLAKLNIRGYNVKQMISLRIVNNFLYWFSTAGLTILFTFLYFALFNLSLRYLIPLEHYALTFPPLTSYLLPLIIILNLFLPSSFLLFNFTNSKKLAKTTSDILNKQNFIF